MSAPRQRMVGTADYPIQIDDWNHQDKIDGQLVVGLRLGFDHRFFVVDQLDMDTLVPIIQDHCATRSHIHSDRWVNRRLENFGFIHNITNTAIARPSLWAITDHNIQSHLDFFCWKKLKRGQGEHDMLLALLKDMQMLYRQ